jgi:prepilin peptidase CpaA
MSGAISWIFAILLGAALLKAAVGDWRTRRIPNWLNAGIALLAIPFWFAIGDNWAEMVIHTGVALFVFLLFSIPFTLGMMGGGDVKLIAALALWLRPEGVVQLLVVMAIAGGVLTLAMLIPHRMARTAGNPEIPYGIAIAFAGFWLIGERILNQFV